MSSITSYRDIFIYRYVTNKSYACGKQSSAICIFQMKRNKYFISASEKERLEYTRYIYVVKLKSTQPDPLPQIEGFAASAGNRIILQCKVPICRILVLIFILVSR